jgi:predicted  nucleic acid-binding Zn ribbon protein
MSNQRQQVNCRVEQSTLTKLKALANGYKYKTCPTCGRDWNLNCHITEKSDPVQHSVLASQLLEQAIDELFNANQN